MGMGLSCAGGAQIAGQLSRRSGKPGFDTGQAWEGLTVTVSVRLFLSNADATFASAHGANLRFFKVVNNLEYLEYLLQILKVVIRR